jgi:hypothetical protein
MHMLYMVRLTPYIALCFPHSSSLSLFLNRFQWVALCHLYTQTRCMLSWFPYPHIIFYEIQAAVKSG